MSWKAKPVVTKPEEPYWCQVCTGNPAILGKLVCLKCRDAISDIAARLAYHTHLTYDEAVRAITVALCDMPKRSAS